MRNTTQPSEPVARFADPEVEGLAREVAELRAENAANRDGLREELRAELRAELETVRVQVKGQNTSSESGDVLGERDRSPKRRLGRHRRNGSNTSGGPSGLVSRRRLFGLFGGAAAAGAGLAVAGSALGADPAGATAVTAGAADGDALQIGGNNNCTSNTGLVSGGGLGVAASDAGGTGLFGRADNGTNARGVDGLSGSGYGLVGNGGQAPLALIGHASAGPPTTGSHVAGEFVVDSAGALFYCRAAGTPGTWVKLSSPFVAVNPPARVFDSRNTGGPIASGQTRAVPVTTGTSIPTGISAVLTNLTAADASGSGFLAMFQHGTTWSGTSNLNITSGQDISNNATSAISAGNPGQVDVRCGGPISSVQFIIDVFGYYP